MHSFVFLSAVFLSAISIIASLLVLIKLRQPVSFIWWGLKVTACALASVFSAIGITVMVYAFIAGYSWIAVPSSYSTVFFLIYIYRGRKPPVSSAAFKKQFGAAVQSLIPAKQQAAFLSQYGLMSVPKVAGCRHAKDVVYHTFEDSDRPLLCDIWEPPAGVPGSGLAFIYCHGSAWCVLDKDFGTRPFFQHLAAQGHVIMDVAYRLFPETDMNGMVQDVYRAIAWMKANAALYNVSPDKIAVGGASAGGHLALLAAYTVDSKFIPPALAGKDLSVCAAITAYGPSDLTAMYYHTGQDKVIAADKKAAAPESPTFIKKITGRNFHRLGMDKNGAEIGMLRVILGKTPTEDPEIYETFSPVKYVHPGCPPTLILQGAHDIISSVDSAKELYTKLDAAGVAVQMNILPQTDHAFDLIMPRIAPAAHQAFYVTERFLALLAVAPKK